MQHHLETFLAESAEGEAEDWRVPLWVERDFRAYLYRILAERWRDADPVLQPRVEGWRERIRALEEGEGPRGS